MSEPSWNPRAGADARRSSSPSEVVRRMIEGALRFLDQAAQLDPLADPSEFTEKLERLRAIARGLRAAPEPGAPPDAVEEQRALYALVDERVHEALAGGTTEPVVDARNALAARLERWERVPFVSREAV